MKVYCDRCKKETEGIVKKKEEIFPVRGEKIKILSNVPVCKICGSEVFDEKLDEENLKLAYDKYRKKHNLLSPSQIKEIREKYGLSQRGLSKLLGWGEITLHRYESGSIQDEAHDKMLKLISHPQNMMKILEENTHRLSESEREKLKEKIADVIKKQTTFILFEHKKEISEFTGYKKFDPEKMKNMILYILQKTGETYRTKINKLLWYMDFYHFKHFSVSISGNFYIHLNYGPIPDNYEFLLGELLNQGMIEEKEVVFDYTKDISGEMIRAKVPFERNIFSKTELESMDYVLKKFKNFTSSQIMKKSHEELPYRKTKEGEKISYNLASEISI